MHTTRVYRRPFLVFTIVLLICNYCSIYSGVHSTSIPSSSRHSSSSSSTTTTTIDQHILKFQTCTSLKELKRAFRRAALESHPDRQQQQQQQQQPTDDGNDDDSDDAHDGDSSGGGSGSDSDEFIRLRKAYEQRMNAIQNPSGETTSSSTDSGSGGILKRDWYSLMSQRCSSSLHYTEAASVASPWGAWWLRYTQQPAPPTGPGEAVVNVTLAASFYGSSSSSSSSGDGMGNERNDDSQQEKEQQIDRFPVHMTAQRLIRCTRCGGHGILFHGCPAPGVRLTDEHVYTRKRTSSSSSSSSSTSEKQPEQDNDHHDDTDDASSSSSQHRCPYEPEWGHEEETAQNSHCGTCGGSGVVKKSWFRGKHGGNGSSNGHNNTRKKRNGTAADDDDNNNTANNEEIPHDDDDDTDDDEIVFLRRKDTSEALYHTCPICCGTGKPHVEPCPVCKGSGAMLRPYTGVLTIPVGVFNGDKISLAQNFHPSLPVDDDGKMKNEGKEYSNSQHNHDDDDESEEMLEADDVDECQGLLPDEDGGEEACIRRKREEARHRKKLEWFFPPMAYPKGPPWFPLHAIVNLEQSTFEGFRVDFPHLERTHTLSLLQYCKLKKVSLRMPGGVEYHNFTFADAGERPEIEEEDEQEVEEDDEGENDDEGGSEDVAGDVAISAAMGRRSGGNTSSTNSSSSSTAPDDSSSVASTRNTSARHHRRRTISKPKPPPPPPRVERMGEHAKDCCSPGSGGVHRIVLLGQGMTVLNPAILGNDMGGSKGLIMGRGHLRLYLRIKFPERVGKADLVEFKQCFGQATFGTILGTAELLSELMASTRFVPNDEENARRNGYYVLMCDPRDTQRNVYNWHLPLEMLI